MDLADGFANVAADLANLAMLFSQRRRERKDGHEFRESTKPSAFSLQRSSLWRSVGGLQQPNWLADFNDVFLLGMLFRVVEIQLVAEAVIGLIPGRRHPIADQPVPGFTILR